MILTQETRSTGEVTCTGATFPHQESHMDQPRIEPEPPRYEACD